MAMTGENGNDGYWGPGEYEPSEDRLARIGIVKVPAKQAVGMSVEEFSGAVEDMRGEPERGGGKKPSKAERERRRIAGTVRVVAGLVAGSEAHRRSRDRR